MNKIDNNRIDLILICKKIGIIERNEKKLCLD